MTRKRGPLLGLQLPPPGPPSEAAKGEDLERLVLAEWWLCKMWVRVQLWDTKPLELLLSEGYCES